MNLIEPSTLIFAAKSTPLPRAVSLASARNPHTESNRISICAGVKNVRWRMRDLNTSPVSICYVMRDRIPEYIEERLV